MAVKNYGIHDKWTNLDKLNNVDIKSVDGVIESVKINGEEAGGGGGSSDFSTAEVSITCVTGNTTTKGKICLCMQNQIAVANYGVPKNQTVTLTVPLYKGSCTWLTEQGEVTLVSGSATIDPENHYVTITGDCTLKIYVKQV